MALSAPPRGKEEELIWYDLPRQTRSLIGYILMGFAFLVALVILIGAITASNRGTARHNAEHKAAMRAANTICGAAPKEVVMHNASGSYPAWIEVHCRNGTVKVTVP